MKIQNETDIILALYRGIISKRMAEGIPVWIRPNAVVGTVQDDPFDCPEWDVLCQDVREYTPGFRDGLDVLLAGFPCQGFSLGGNRDENDERNMLYKQVVRIADVMRPRVVVMENVLNLRTMYHPITRKPFAVQIAEEIARIGYTTKFQFFRVSEYGVPQTQTGEIE